MPLKKQKKLQRIKNNVVDCTAYGVEHRLTKKKKNGFISREEYVKNNRTVVNGNSVTINTNDT